jgi:hypothetical protein
MHTYWSPVSPDFVPRSAISAACLFKLRNCSCLALWYSGMNIGPGGACAFLKGSVPSQAVKAGRYSSRKRRSKNSAAYLPSSFAASQLLKVSLS